MKIAYYAGTFDVPHIGHACQVEKLKEMGYSVVVSINGDDFVKANRGKAPLFDQDERAVMFEQLESVDRVVICERFEQQEELLISLMPDVVVLGSDWIGKDVHAQYGVPDGWFGDVGISLLFLPRAECSASEVRDRIGDSIHCDCGG